MENSDAERKSASDDPASGPRLSVGQSPEQSLEQSLGPSAGSTALPATGQSIGPSIGAAIETSRRGWLRRQLGPEAVPLQGAHLYQRRHQRTVNPCWQRGRRMLLVLLIPAAFLLPLLLGLLGTVLPAFGWMPGFGATDAVISEGTESASGLVSGMINGSGFRDVIHDPRTVPALLLTLFTGLSATVLVLLLTVLTLVAVHDTRGWRWLQAALPPLLAVPHAAMAVGLAFLVAPSGWLVRLVSPELSGWDRPPLDWVVPDADGWSLILGLVIKETPFLLLVAGAQLAALDVNASLKIGRSLGYAPARCWSRLILPQLYPRVRKSLLVILAFNLSVVDMALLLGPGNPPTFAVMLMSLVNDPGSRAAASAGALMLAILVAAHFVALSVLERGVARLARYRRTSGRRGLALGHWRRGALVFIGLMLVISALSLLMLPVWSLARRWRFPEVWPTHWTLDTWSSRGDLLINPLLTTLSLALVSAVLALVASIAWLEARRLTRSSQARPRVGKSATSGRTSGFSAEERLDWLWYLPLLVPQVSLLFGWQASALLLSIDGSWWTVAYAHWVYCMPYVVLILAVAWRESDPRWEHAAAVLGAGYWRILWRVRLPLLIRPVSQALAVAMAVSVAQYLPTLLLGAGRHQTLAIELVTSFGGADRRTIAALAVLQSLLPLIAFVLAMMVPAWLQRSRQRQ